VVALLRETGLRAGLITRSSEAALVRFGGGARGSGDAGRFVVILLAREGGRLGGCVATLDAGFADAERVALLVDMVESC
jgi:hypothetical protein